MRWWLTRKVPIAVVARLALRAFRLAESSRVFRQRVFRPMAMAFVEEAVRRWRRGGVDAWREWHLPVARAVGEARSEYLRRKLEMDAKNARSLGSIHDYEDPLFGIEGHWEEEGSQRAVRIETHCPLGERLRQLGCPDFCRVLVHAFEDGTLRPVHSEYQLEPLEELLSAGDSRCRFVHRLPPPQHR